MPGTPAVPVLSGFSGFVPGLRDAQLEKPFQAALSEVRSTPFKRDLPPAAPEVKVPERSFPWERKNDCTPIPGYTGHIARLHDFKFQRTFGRAAQAASEYTRPLTARGPSTSASPAGPVTARAKTPEPAASGSVTARVERVMPGYTGFVPRQREFDLGMTFAAATERARSLLPPQTAEPPERALAPQTRARPSSAGAGRVPGYTGYVPGQRDLSVGRTYGAVTRESEARFPQPSHHAPTKTDAYSTPSPRVPTEGPYHIPGYRGFVPGTHKPEKPFPQRTREALSRLPPSPGDNEFLFRKSPSPPRGH